MYVLLNIRECIWFKHDDALPNFSPHTSNWLINHLPDEWIGHSGPILWPQRSPDLNPFNFYRDVWVTEG